jgi:hypothetical protein
MHLTGHTQALDPAAIPSPGTLGRQLGQHLQCQCEQASWILLGAGGQALFQGSVVSPPGQMQHAAARGIEQHATNCSRPQVKANDSGHL